MEVTFINRARILAAISVASLITVCAFNFIAYGNETEDVAVAEKYVNMEDVSATQTSVIANVVDVSINEDQIIRVALTEDYTNINYTSIETEATLSTVPTSSEGDILVQDIVGSMEIAQQELDIEVEQARLKAEAEEIAKAKANLASRTYSTTQTQGGLLDIANPDPNYTGKSIRITGNDRVILEKLVMGESGNQGFEGSALVAQCIRDMYILGGFDSVDAVRRSCGYSASLRHEPNQNVKDAVSFIFDEGGYAVKHRILYFYAPRYSKGSFHETQNLVINYVDHKFFDRRY